MNSGQFTAGFANETEAAMSDHFCGSGSVHFSNK